MRIDHHLTERLDTLRHALEVDMKRMRRTQAELASQLGMSQQSLSKWLEKGNVPARRVEELLKALGPNSETAAHLSRRQRANAEAVIANFASPTPFVSTASAAPPENQALLALRAAAHDDLQVFFTARPRMATGPRMPDFVGQHLVMSVADSVSDVDRCITSLLVHQRQHPGDARKHWVGLFDLPASAATGILSMRAGTNLAAECALLGLWLQPAISASELAASIAEIELEAAHGERSMSHRG